MTSQKTQKLLKILVLVSFTAMIVVNALSEILPINGLSTGQISNFYPNLFTPTAITFSIWGLIYLFLACYTVFQLKGTDGDKDPSKAHLFSNIRLAFCLSCLANILWIFSWHYRLIVISMLFMLMILFCLIYIAGELNKIDLTKKEKIFIKLPFSLYFGWITVATIANATVLLVSLGWNGFGIPASIWTVIILFVGLIIGVLTMLKTRGFAYGLAIIWAYIGILIKHVSANGFASAYPFIIITVIISILILLLTEIYLLISFLKKNRR